MADDFTRDRMAWLETVLLSKADGLTAFARVVGVTIGQHLNREDGYAYPSVLQLADMLGATEKGVRGAVQALERAGLLRVQRTVGRELHNRYFLTGSNGQQPIADWHRDWKAARGARQKTPPVGSGSDTGKPHRPVPKTPPLGSPKPHPSVLYNPLTKPFDENAARPVDEKALAEELFALMPRGSASRSNRTLVGQAAAELVAGGVQPRALILAVRAFVKASPDAKDQDGRFMGPADRWLTTKRGWEAYLPSADEMFLDALPQTDRDWLYRVRSWQRTPGYWRIKADDFGPEPGQPGCRVPSHVIRHALACEPANDTTESALPKGRVTWV